MWIMLNALEKKSEQSVTLIYSMIAICFSASAEYSPGLLLSVGLVGEGGSNFFSVLFCQPHLIWFGHLKKKKQPTNNPPN